MKPHLICVLISILASFNQAQGQQTIFEAVQTQKKLADQYFKEPNFSEAIRIYAGIVQEGSASKDSYINLARSYYQLKKFREAVATYNQLIEQKSANLPEQDVYYYAEAQCVLTNYPSAIEFYKKYLELNPANELVKKKIWQISNRQYLYEDSAKFAVNSIALNTSAGEFAPFPYRDGILFTSNRKGTHTISKVNVSGGNNFYKVFYSTITKDSTGIATFQKPALFKRKLQSKFNTSSFIPFDGGKKFAFISSIPETNDKGFRSLGIYFINASSTEKSLSEFPYNSRIHAITSFYISDDGKSIYYSSDMPGGLGGKDIYKTTYVDGRWTTPKNLGEPINTPGDETFPFLFNEHTLYFSSHGHAGLGGLDIFKADSGPSGFIEPENIGYPMNSSQDDFGIMIDSTGNHGYFTSNRLRGEFDDDLYEFETDIQVYPITISGLVKFKEHSWSDASELKMWPSCKMQLIDRVRQTVVYETVSDLDGNFSIVIPYFSKYVIQSIDDEGNPHKASLEISKYKKESGTHEVVFIKDFSSLNDNK